MIKRWGLQNKAKEYIYSYSFVNVSQVFAAVTST
jgi:hypothetical protein